MGPETEIMKRNAVVKNQGTEQRGQRFLGDCWQLEANGQCSKGDNCSFRHDVNKRAKMTQPNPSPNSFMHQDERKASRTRSPRGKSPSGSKFRLPCNDYLKGTCTTPFCEKGILQSACSTSQKMDADLWKSALMHIARLMNSVAKGPKRMAVLKKYELHDRTRQPVVCLDTRHAQGHGPVVCSSSSTRQLGCVFQDMESPKLPSILRKNSDIQKPIQRVKFTKAICTSH